MTQVSAQNHGANLGHPRTMKYICLGYYDRSKNEAMTEAEKQAMFGTCFTYDDHLRANGHWGGGELPLRRSISL
jgi:hypothetical protein